MRGYIIFDDTTGELRHHGCHQQLPKTFAVNEKVIEISEEQAAELNQMFARGGRFFISPPYENRELRYKEAEYGAYALIRLDPLPAASTPSVESALERAIARNTAAVEALTERIDRLFAR